MYEHEIKWREDKKRNLGNSVSQKNSYVKQDFGFVEKRKESIQQSSISNSGKFIEERDYNGVIHNVTIQCIDMTKDIDYESGLIRFKYC
ncbi:hypothetical protein FNH22_30155 [Fulvivirga sp. M361]|uniref:hypothetical protein n=1 Tax=Fulvivirga sp. M361 TaxID=2594266 RepID=UPI00117B2A61|nr:hypothetical protein [Fulvivirga sp. M361]TRX47253.1 hypothetical protein FNH22_30155 [Fulvivirga sp. M361]